MKSKAEPKGWPGQLPYLAKPLYSKLISQDTLDRLHAKPSGIDALVMKDGPSPNVNIISIQSSNHPAKGQYGLFANKNLPPGSFILFYIGFVHGEKDANPGSDYDLSLDRDLGISVDAAKMGNEARFINDYRGISSTGPNAEFKEVWVNAGKGAFERRMAVYVLPAGKSGKRSAGIKKEEILVSYGKSFWKQRETETLDDIASSSAQPEIAP